MKNTTAVITALVTIAVWELVFRQEGVFHILAEAALTPLDCQAWESALHQAQQGDRHAYQA